MTGAGDGVTKILQDISIYRDASHDDGYATQILEYAEKPDGKRL